MAIPAGAVWELRSTATAGNVNGGFFNSARGGVDYTLQDTAQLTLTDCTSTGALSVILRSATGGFTSNMVGNGIYIASGTAFTVGWYEIVSFTSSNAVSLDRAFSAGPASAGTIRVGGALSLNSTLDDEFIEAIVPGNSVWIKSGSYTLGENVSQLNTPGTTTTPIPIRGYQTTRGDNPTGANRPLIACATNSLSINQNTQIENIIFTTTNANGVVTGVNNLVRNCKITNTSSTAGRPALTVSQSSAIVNNELISQNGSGLLTAAFQQVVQGNYIHDSSIGIQLGGNTVPCFFNVIARNRTAGISITGSDSRTALVGNTIFGAVATPIGEGIRTTNSTSPNIQIYNNIIYGHATGISISTTQQNSIIENYNDFSNNTTDRALIATGANSITTAPSFTDTVEITGSTATTSGSVLTQSGGNFNTVEDNVDFLRVVSGTGVTTGCYLITSHTSTTLTVNNALGTSSAGNVTYVIGTGHNFSVGTGLKATGFPGAFPGSTTTSYLDIGAVQRQEPSGGGGSGGSFTFVG